MHCNNHCCREEPPLDTKISGQKFEGKWNIFSHRICPPGYLLTTWGKIATLQWRNHLSQVIEVKLTSVSRHITIMNPLIDALRRKQYHFSDILAKNANLTLIM